MPKTFEGSIEFTTNFDVQTTRPLDVRLVVDNYDDLTNGSIDAPYQGMVVNIKGTSELWVLKTVSIEDSHNPNNWELITGVNKIDIGNENVNNPTRKLGGLNASTFGNLHGRTFNEVLLNILREDVIEPTKISINDVTIAYDGDKLIEVGTILPMKSEIISTINDGIWSDGTPYSGSHTILELANLWTSDIWNGNDLWIGSDFWNDLSHMDNEFGIPSKEGVYKIVETVDFTQGGIPQDNYHNTYPEKQYNGGSLQSNTIEIISVYPIYINNGDNIKFIQKQPLVDYLTSMVELEDIDIQNEIDGTLDKFSIYLPGYFNTLEVKQFNPLTKQYDIDINMIPISENYIIDNDKISDIKYIKYIRNDDIYDTVGHTKYKIKLKKYVKDI